MMRHTTNRLIRSTAAFGIAAAVALGGAEALKAQTSTFTFVGETAGDDVHLLLGDADFVFGLGELRPVVGLQGFIVVDDFVDQTLWAVTPSAGLRWAQPTGFLQGKVGYQWVNEDPVTPFFGGGESGVTTSLHGEFWGDGRFGAQAIGVYNWGADYAWTRARGTARIFPTADGGVNLGVEGGWQGHTGAAEADYGAVMIGPVLQWVMPNVTAGVGAGWKNVTGTVRPEESTWYGRLELVFSPF